MIKLLDLVFSLLTRLWWRKGWDGLGRVGAVGQVFDSCMVYRDCSLVTVEVGEGRGMPGGR